MGIVTVLAAAAALGAQEPRSWPSSGGFDVLQLESSCALHTTYSFDGRAPVEMTLFLEQDGPALLLQSGDWSSRGSEEYAVTYRLDDVVYDGTAFGVRGISGSLAARFEDDFLPAFARADDLLVHRGETVITHLSLEGSAGAVATLRRCFEYLTRESAARARREQRWDYIERNPFAEGDPPVTPVGPAKPTEISNVTWQRQPTPEFPERAASRGIESGTVNLVCTVAANGSATNCSIVSENPSGAGFGQAALRSMSRARFSPRTVDSVVDGGRARFTLRFQAGSMNSAPSSASP